MPKSISMINYTFSYRLPNRQYLDVLLDIFDVNDETTYLQLPAWRPGRYQMASFAANIQRFEPCDENDNPLPFQKVNSHCWAVANGKATSLKVYYNYYAATLDAGNTFLDENQLYLNPINCAMYPHERLEEECRVQLSLPEDYMVATPLKRAGKNTFEAKDFHHLVDSPIIASDSLKRTCLDCEGYTFHLWFSGIANPNYDQIKADFQSFIKKALEPFREFPASSYHFYYLLPAYPLSHGVEHQQSTVIALGPGYNLMQPAMYKKFLAISCHELYHTWNVKQIRPVEMTPYRYQEPNYTSLNYVAEGATSYYGDLILLRSGVFSFEDYKQQFNNFLVRHLHNYGRFHRSVAESSFDTWLDGYQPSAPARKTSIYIKGMLVAFLLDIEIMRLTGNDASLDSVMVKLYQDYAKANQGYSKKDLKETIEVIAGTSFDLFFEDYIEGTEPLEKPLSQALDYLGLELKQVGSSKNWEKQFGFKVQDETGYPKVSQVAPGSPAEAAGLSVKDELIAVNGLKIDGNLADLFAYYHSDTIQLTLFRRNDLKHLHLASNGRTFFQDAYIELQSAPSKAHEANFVNWSQNDMSQLKAHEANPQAETEAS